MYIVKDAVDFFDMVGQTEWNRDMHRTLIHWTGIRDTDEALEAGCGAGHFVMQLAARCQAVTGLDVSAEMARRAELNAEDHKLSNTSFVTGTANNLPFPDDSFHLVTCINLLFMFDKAVVSLGELLRVCKSNGQVIVVNPSSAMNPWTAERYCEQHRLFDFERESLVSYATAAAKYGTMDEDAFSEITTAAGGKVVETLTLLDGLVFVARVTPNE